RFISRIKSSSRHEVTIPNPVFRCSEFGGVTDGYYWEYTPGMFIHLFLYIDDMVFSYECKAEILVTNGLLDKAKENVLGIEIIKDQSGNTLRVSQSRFYNMKLVQTLLEGHSKLSLEGSLLSDCDVEKNGKCSYVHVVGSQEYQVVCTRPSTVFAGVDMLDGFDCGLQTNVQDFVDFDYSMGRSITGGMYDIYQGIEERSYLAKGTLGRRNKHNNVRYHFIREVLEAKTVEVLKVGTEHNVADALTKVVPGHKLQHCLELLSVAASPASHVALTCIYITYGQRRSQGEAQGAVLYGEEDECGEEDEDDTNKSHGGRTEYLARHRFFFVPPLDIYSGSAPAYGSVVSIKRIMENTS
ncbi:hypothetical protein Tco_0695165, partial [Tanacetum coccineum]